MISLFHPTILTSYEDLKSKQKPSFFKDLGLDAIISKIIEQYGNADIEPYFVELSDSLETTKFRNEIMVELQNPTIRKIVTEFVEGVHKAEQYKANYEAMAPHAPQKWKWLLDSIIVYYTAMETLCIKFNETTPKAIGLYYMHRFFYDILNVDDIKKLRMKAFELNDEFEKMSFRITLNKDRATFSMEKDENDFTYRLRNAYHHGHADKRPQYFEEAVFPTDELSDLEQFVSDLFREKNRLLYRDMETFLALNRKVVSDDVLEIVRQLEFYLAYTGFVTDMKKKGFPFSMPKISKDKELYLGDCYDVSLAITFSEDDEMVYNDIVKSNYEKAMIVIGPEKSGKTTLGKAFGQCYYFGNMGLPVPARIAKLPYVNRIFTVFGVEAGDKDHQERAIRSELMLLKKSFAEMNDTRFVIIANELFMGAPTVDALNMNRSLLLELLRRHGIVFYIMDTPEMSGNSDQYVTLQATVVGDGSNRRTYRIIRKDPEELSYSDSIVDKYKLNFDHIDFRIKNNSGIDLY